MANLLTGLGGEAGFGENLLGRNDDGFTGFVDVSSVFANGLNFFGATYNGFFINNNGGITFNSGRGQFTPSSIVSNTNNPEIDAFYADVDTRGGAVAATPGGASTGSNLLWYDLDTLNRTVTITWDDVGYFGSHTDKLNSFQIVLTDASGLAGRQAGDFDIGFRYEDINWTTGDASGGTGGLGGTVARAGFSAGQGTPTSFFELPQSGNQEQMLALEDIAGNTGEAGLWRFEVRNGDVPAVVSIRADTPEIGEGDVGSFPAGFTVTRTGDLTGSLTVDYTITGFGNQQADNLDFTAITLPSTGQVTFAAGQATATIDVFIEGDTIIESNQSFAITLTGTSDPAVGFGNRQAVATIIDNDNPIPPIPSNWGQGFGLGDPHLTTLDGLHYDFQAVGEFHLVQSDSGSFDVQVRTQPAGGSQVVSIITAVATEVDGIRVTYSAADDTLRIGGVATTIDPSVGFVAVGSNGGAVYQAPDGGYQVGYPDGLQIVTFRDFGAFLNVDVAVDPSLNGQIRGLLGDADGTSANDVALPDGTVLATPYDYAEFYGLYANAWRIAQSEALFDYAAGESTATYTDAAFPRQVVTLDQLPDDLVAAARAAAQAAGITDPVLIDDAALDFILTSDGRFLDASADAPRTPVADADVTNAPPTVGVGIGALLASQDERNAGDTPFTFRIYRTDGSGELVVNYAVQVDGGSGSANAADFGGALPAGSITFQDGETERDVTIAVRGDVVPEFDESFRVAITSTSTPVTILAESARSVIANDDGPVVARLSVSADTGAAAEGDAGQTVFTFTVTREGDLTGVTTVDLVLEGDGTANSADGSDFVGGFGTRQVTFQPGATVQTIEIAVSGDTVVEPNETFRVRLDNVGGGVIDTGTASSTITNDDTATLPPPVGGVVAIPGVPGGETRLTFTSSEVGNGSPRDSNTQPNQDGGLAVRAQAEDANGDPTGTITRYTDEGITFVSATAGATFDVRDLPTGTPRGDQFTVVALGTRGNDTLSYANASDPVYLNGGQGVDTLVGGSGADVLVGGTGSDRLTGNGGDDLFIGGAGDDRIIGGAGTDTVLHDIATGGADYIILGYAQNEAPDVVRVSAPAAGQVRLTFTSSEVGNGNYKDGGTLANQDGSLAVRMQAEDPAGALAGPVTRIDDEGTTFVAATPGLTFDVRDLVSGAARGDGFGVVTLGTKYTEVLTAADAPNVAHYINGGAGMDRITGGSAADFLVGGAGNDVLAGGDGDDTFIGGLGNDRIDGNAGNDTVLFNISTDGADQVVLGFAENDRDTVRVTAASAGQVRLTFDEGGVGNGDYKDAGSSEPGGFAVRMRLEAPNGTLTGPESRYDDEGMTFVADRDGLTFDVRDLVSGGARGDGYGVVMLGTKYTETLAATSLDVAHYIAGGQGADTIVGGNGADFLVGGVGGDTLTGGGGADRFYFDVPVSRANADTITDFTLAEDLILLDSAIFGLPKGALGPNAFAASSSTSPDAHILYDAATGGVFFDANGGLHGDAVRFATLANKPAGLSAGDFLVV